MNNLITIPAPAAAGTISLNLLYDAFSPSTVEHHSLVYQPGLKLADYLAGLPDDVEWAIFHNGMEIAQPLAHTIDIALGDQVGLILVPQGGDDFKAILRVVMMIAAIAVVILAPQLGLTVYAAMAISAGITIVSAIVLAPKGAGGMSDNAKESASYGIDGAKNSATENIVYPVIYGEYRFGGNYCDTYTENVGDDQYLYLRSVFNDGEIEGIYDIELNEQPITNFTLTETRIKKGSLSESVNDWFGRSLRQFNKSVKLDTTFVSHQTTTAVDRVRFDVVFNSGLVTIDSKKGSYSSKSVTFEMRYRLLDPETKQPVTDIWSNATANASNYIPTTVGGASITGMPNVAALSIAAKTNFDANAMQVQYQEDGGAWTPVAATSVASNPAAGYSLDANGQVTGYSGVTPMTSAQYSVDGMTGSQVAVRALNGEIEYVTAYPSTASDSFTVTDSRAKQLRRSFESGALTPGFYEVQLRRTTPTSADQYQLDEVWLTDVAEINSQQVAMIGTANLSLRVKLSEQLNAIPTMTGRVRGSILQQYDMYGVPTVREWSANCAWVGLDILLGEQRGSGLSSAYIDWPAWYEFSEHCRINNLGFNGVFEQGTNVGDALQTVLRCAHAAPVPRGRTMSVAIDRLRDPVAFFGQGSINKGTFEINYMPVTDRANEYNISYYDKNDRNKEKTIRYVDPKAVLFNETPRAASVSLIGIDNIQQARAELWRSIYSNRLLIRSIAFEANLEAINMTIGENALIQHNQMEWADSGRTISGSTASRIMLDQSITMAAGKSYALLIHYDAIARVTANISDTAGTAIMIPTNAALTESTRVTRMVAATGAFDVEILSVTKGNTYDTIRIAEANALIQVGRTVSLWDTDVLEERAVTLAVGTQSFVDLETPMHAAPDVMRNFTFGEVLLVRKPYTLIGVTGNGVEKRKLSFVEYHEGVYGPSEVEIPIPIAAISDRDVAHVQTVLFDYERLVAANRKSIGVRVHWSAAGIRNYAGADIYMALNGSAMRAIGSALNVTEFLVTLNDGDVPEFRVVAYNQRGDRAQLGTAPSVRGTISVVYATLSAPTAVTGVVANFQVEGSGLIHWTPPSDMTGVEDYEVQYRRPADGDAWTSLGYHAVPSCPITALQTGSYEVQVRSNNPTSWSPWASASFVVAVTPGSLLANFLSSNDRNADAITAPTTNITNDIQSVLNTDGSADVSFQWTWGGDESTIDGFEVIYSASTS